MSWRLAVEDLADSEQIASLKFKALHVTWVLNGPGAIEVELDFYGSWITNTNLLSGRKQLILYHDSDIVWGGYLQGHRVNIQQDKRHTLMMHG